MTDLDKLIECAVLAPSGHNTQPWRFRASGSTIRIFADPRRRLPVVDPDDHALYISLGCALENLVIAAERHGFQPRVELFPPEEPEPCLRVRLETGAAAGDESLYRAVPVRQSNRRRYDGRAIPEDDVKRLLEAARGDAVRVESFRVGTPRIDPIIELVREANREQFADRAFVDELVSWIRFSRGEARARLDGVTGPALGFPWVPRRLGVFIMTRLLTPQSEARRQARMIGSSALLLLFIARHNNPPGWVRLGRSFERVALTATALGIAHAHVNMPCEVLPVRTRLAHHLELSEGEQPLLLVRFGYARPMPRAPRRPLEQVLEHG